MKINDVNIDQLLYTPEVRQTPYDHGEEEGGILKKIFSKKEKPHVPYFTARIEALGKDDIAEDLRDGYDAYWIKGAPRETMVVLSHSYLILPGREVFPFYDMLRFAIKNEHYGNRPYEQYAIDRFNEPYDPDYVSEYANEEGFELSRFNILLEIIDENNLQYEYVFPMEVADRRDFRAKFNERLSLIGGQDFSEEDVLDGRFPDDE